MAILVLSSHARAATDDSLYQVPLEFVDEDARSFTLASLANSPVIITMAYTRCKTACPITMQRLKAIDQKLTESGKSVQFVVASLDPERDQPSDLKSLEKKYGVDESRWHLVKASEQDTRTLSQLLSYSYRKNPGDGEFHHSNVIVLLNSKGEMVERLEGLSSPVEPFVEKIIETLEKAS